MCWHFDFIPSFNGSRIVLGSCSVQAVLSNPSLDIVLIDGQIHARNPKGPAERGLPYIATHGGFKLINSQIHARNPKGPAERDLLCQTLAEDSFCMQS